MPAQEIRVVHRSDESGTTDSFQQYLQPASAGAWTRGAGNTFKGGVGQGAPGNQGTAEAVETTPGAITYNEWSSAINQELATADIRTPAGITHIGTDWTGTSIAPVTITGQGNNLVLDMTLAFQPSAKFGYPILLAGYAIVCSRYPDPATGEAVKAFLQSAVTPRSTASPRNPPRKRAAASKTIALSSFRRIRHPSATKSGVPPSKGGANNFCRFRSVEVPVGIHSLMEYTHHIDHVVAADPVVQRVRSDSVLAVARADVIAGPSDRRIRRDAFDRTLDFAQVLLGLIVIPPFRAVIPDLFQIGACGW